MHQLVSRTHLQSPAAASEMHNRYGGQFRRPGETLVPHTFQPHPNYHVGLSLISLILDLLAHFNKILQYCFSRINLFIYVFVLFGGI